LRILVTPFILLKGISKTEILWSSSDFLPDTLPAFVFKLFHPKSTWFSSFFLSARNPFTHEVAFNFKTLFYFLSQRIAIGMFRMRCDVIFVLSELDRTFLVGLGIDTKKIYLLAGGVDLTMFDSVRSDTKIYDACFIGRFHYQKGLPDLFYSWSKVKEQKSNAVFAVVGWGDDSQVAEVNSLIHKYSLEDNVKLLGFLDGLEKIKVLKSSKVLCFPSTFESWGVVVAEGIAAGIPVVAYDLPVLRDKFKSGVSFVPTSNMNEYADEVIKLLFDGNYGKSLVDQASAFRNTLGWDVSVKVLQGLVN
jgi:glycosyltransferase involved in cell wall biosynthesis